MATMTPARRPWTKPQTKTLIRLINKKWRARQIGNALKRSPGAVNQKIGSLGLKLKSGTTGKKHGAAKGIRRGASHGRRISHRTRG